MNDQLLDLIRGARRRWRLRLVLRGVALLAACTLATVLIATWGMDRFRFTPSAVRFFQIAAWISIAVVAWRALGGGIRRRASDTQVALYLEEHEPTLEGRLLAAVSFNRAQRADVSRAMVDRLVADAVRQCEARPAWRQIERRGIATAGAVLAATLISSALLVLAGPGFLGPGARFLLPGGGVEGRPYTIGVEPGDTVIARGADLSVLALLRGFEASQVELVVRRSGEESWERVPMAVEDAGRHGALVLDLRTDLEYFVEASGVRSEAFTVRVADIPWVDDIAIEYRFPGYTGMAPQRQQGGDIAALAGTVAHIIVKPTLAVTEGMLIALGRDTVALAADTGGTLRGALTVRESGEYRILFPGPDHRLAAGSPPYAIDVLTDQPPEISFTKPGRDADATSVDEIFIEARARDDVGVRRMDLVYRVNGGPERTVRLHTGPSRREVVAGHTVFLEELNLQPGDVIAYHGRALDARPDTAAALTDIYFLTIRPFDRAFREAEQSGMPGQAGVDAGEMSERQRQIVAGTFRVARERSASGEPRFREDLATLALAQGRLREEVETLVRRLRTRGVAAADSSMAVVADALDSAVIAMRGAERELGRRLPNDALTPEQRALTHLQRAEAVFDRERQVARGQQGGGGGGNAASAEELADLFELELDRMRNQYETVERDQQSNDNAQVDETLERVRELARRQQQENERRRAQGSSSASSAGSAGQRRMAEEAEELARRLERLSREREDQELDAAARSLREAAEQMRRSGASQGSSANAAMDRLRQAQRDLERGRSSGLRRSVDEARQRAQRLNQQQEQSAQEVGSLATDTAGRAGRVQRLLERKNLMAQDVGALEDELERLAREAQRDQPQAAQRLRDAARGLREGRVEDKIRYSRGLVQAQPTEVARNFEETIGADLDSLGRRLDAAAEAIGESREDRVGRALERARDAANALEGVAERAQERQGRETGETGRGERQGNETGEQKQGQQGQQGQQGRDGQKGEGGQNGREGQKGQPGQPRGGQPQSGDAPGIANRGGGGMDAETRRQLGRSLDEQRRELRDIREQLRREGVDTGELDALIDALARGNDGIIGSPRGIENLTQVIVPGLREFEFGVRRAVSGTVELPRVGSEGAVPERYRRAVSEYYRGLSEPRNDR